MNRIDNKFKTLKEQGKKALITFITAGDPDKEATLDFIYAMEQAGADIIELGMPYSDPIAEGPVIQASSARALKNNFKLDNIFEIIEKARTKTEMPLAIMIYFNCIFIYGVEKFFERAKKVGADAVIIPDISFEERDEFTGESEKYQVPVISFVTPNSYERTGKMVRDAKGFVYCVSSLGVTGLREGFHERLAEFTDEIKKYTDVPRAIGFGISGSEQIKELKKHCEGVIVGSAIVKRIGEAGSVEEAVSSVRSFTEQLRIALDE